MIVQWHGRGGRSGKDYSILTVALLAALPAQHADERYGIKARPAQTGRELRLLHGANEVTRADWEAAKKIALVKIYLDEGKIEQINAETLDAMDAPTAKTLVNETIDLNLLQKWRKAETRDDVVKFIDDHVGKLTAKPPSAPAKK